MDPAADDRGTAPDGGWRRRLADLPPLDATLAGLDPEALPDTPMRLFADWLDDAITAGVPQPHAAGFSSAGEGGPTSRTLLVKDVDELGVWFATSSTNPMGLELAARPRAAALFHWKERGRQIRLGGSVRAGTAEQSAADFLARHPSARAEVLLGRQSTPRPDEREAAAALADARRRVDADPGLVAEDWTAYRLRVETADFWAASPGHGQLRVGYRLDAGSWVHERLWP